MPVVNPHIVRRCRKCGVDFSGVRCKPCESAYRAARYTNEKKRFVAERSVYYQKNKEAIKSRVRKYAKENPNKLKACNAAYRAENSDKLKAGHDKWRHENLERTNKSKLEWASNNKDKVRAAAKAWAKRNPDALRSVRSNRRARKIAAGGKLSSNIAERLFKLQKGLCACCKQRLDDDYHLDHIMPLALGGSNTDGNMQLLKSRCNLQKNKKHPVAFMQSRGFLL